MIERCAGVLVPLFSMRTAGDFGRGDIAAMLPMGRLALAMGHRLIQLLPLDETAGAETSPYAALSVLAIDPAYISATGLSGVSAAEVEDVRRQLPTPRQVPDLIAIRAAKRKLLERAYRNFSANGDRDSRDAFAAFRDQNRAWLDDYALFNALKDQYGSTRWETWPERLRRHESGAVAEAAHQLAERIATLQFFQFTAQQQWLAVRESFARDHLMVGGDLAFSPGRESAEVWANQQFFDLDCCVGAPPDVFSETGQRWGLPMPNWERIRTSGFAFLRTRVRRARQLYDALRVDHVVGLFRTYGYFPGAKAPGSFTPSSEPAQQAQGEEILKIILDEAGPMQIVAEDLGVIPPFVRASLAALGVPGYKVVRWEKEPSVGPGQRFFKPADYPELALATTGTHDTETFSEWWSLISSDERRRFHDAMGVADTTDGGRTLMSESTLDAILAAIYASPSRLVVLPLQDLFGWNDRINIPGTIGTHNWTWRLPFDLERGLESIEIKRRLTRLIDIARRTNRF